MHPISNGLFYSCRSLKKPHRIIGLHPLGFLIRALGIRCSMSTLHTQLDVHVTSEEDELWDCHKGGAGRSHALSLLGNCV